MKHFVLFVSLGLTTTLFAASDFGYLKKEDQQYYKNDSMEGNNQRERIDSTVKEINKLHGEIISLKSEIAQLKQEVQQLKAASKK